MNNHGTVVANAKDVVRRLTKESLDNAQPPKELQVSFRDPDGAVGRRDVATHLIHWYPAKMFHRIPSAFLDSIDLPAGANVLDPFCGSGTVLLEAKLRGHNAIGVDINPLARLISHVKLTQLTPDTLNTHLELVMQRSLVDRSAPRPQSTLDAWLMVPAREALHQLSAAISDIADPDYRSFFLVTLTSIVRKVSTADPSIPPLVHLRVNRAETAGKRYRTALERSQGITASSVYSMFTDAATTNIARMSELHVFYRRNVHNWHTVIDAEAAHTGLRSQSVDAIITSPPYCGAQKYVRSLKLEMLLSGCPENYLKALDRATLGTETVRKPVGDSSNLLTGDAYIDPVIMAIYNANPVRAKMASDYCKYLVTFANECRRVLRPGGHLLVTLGRSTLAGTPFLTDRIFRHICRAVGLHFVATLIDRIPSRGLLTQRHRTAGRIDFEFIVWLRCLSTSSGNRR